MSKPVVFGPAYSTYARTVRLALIEKGVDYDLVEVDILGAGVPPEHYQRHPFGKVPAFEHDGFTLYETGAITRYVDEAFDGPALQPADAPARARMVQVQGVVDSYLYAPTVSQVVIQRLVVPLQGGTPDQSVIEAAGPALDRGWGAIAGFLNESGWLAGGGLSLADLHLAPVMDYFSKTPEGEAMLARHASVADWWRRVGAMPSVQETAPALG